MAPIISLHHVVAMRLRRTQNRLINLLFTQGVEMKISFKRPNISKCIRVGVWADPRMERECLRRLNWSFQEGLHSDTDYDVWGLAWLFGEEEEGVELGPPPYICYPQSKKITRIYPFPRREWAHAQILPGLEDDFYGLHRLFYLVDVYVDWGVRIRFVQTSDETIIFVGNDIIFKN